MGDFYGEAKEIDPEFQKFLGGYVKEQGPYTHAIGTRQNRLVKKAETGKLDKNQFLGHGYFLGASCYPITFKPGEFVETREGRKGKVLGSIFMDDLVFFEERRSGPSVGHWVVKVDFGDFKEYFVRGDVKGGQTWKIDWFY